MEKKYHQLKFDLENLYEDISDIILQINEKNSATYSHSEERNELLIKKAILLNDIENQYSPALDELEQTEKENEQKRSSINFCDNPKCSLCQSSRFEKQKIENLIIEIKRNKKIIEIKKENAWNSIQNTLDPKLKEIESSLNNIEKDIESLNSSANDFETKIAAKEKKIEIFSNKVIEVKKLFQSALSIFNDLNFMVEKEMLNIYSSQNIDKEMKLMEENIEKLGDSVTA